jgi:uncharacterized protein YjdB
MKKLLVFLSILCFAVLLTACDRVKISFEDEEITIMVGDERQLEPVVSDETLVLEWSSSDDDIVDVDGTGKVTGLAVGNAEITVTIKDKNKSAKIKVIVIEFDAEISFDKQSVNVALGSTLTLVPIVTPQKAVTFTWSSSDEEIATVDQTGKVTPLAVGETTITASGRGKSASIKVNVIIPDPTSILIKGYSSTIVKAGTTVQLSADVIPQYAIQGVDWSSSDETIATVDEDGLVTFVGIGDVTITAAAKVKPTVLNTVEFLVGGPDPVSITVTAPDDKTEIAVLEGMLLTATVEPELAAQTVTWSVSDSTVGQVNVNGYFTALKEGTVTVYATSTVDENVVGEIEITVYVPDPESITVTGDYNVLMVDEEMTLSFEVSPATAYQTVTFESSDTDILTVDENGKVKAIAEGEAFITVKSTVDETISVTYEIKVVAKIEEFDKSFLLVDPTLEGERFETITFDSHELILGLNALTDIAAAFALIEDNTTVMIMAGTYTSKVTIKADNVTILGPNADINPVTNLDDREEEAEITNIITLDGVENLVIKGLKFSAQGQIYSYTPLKNLHFENLYYVDSNVNPAEGVLYLGLPGEDDINENILVKNCSFNDTKFLGYRGVRINNAKDLTVEGCYFYMFYDSIRLEGSANSSWGTDMGTGSGASGVLNIRNNVFEDCVQYPIVVSKYMCTEVNITDNYLGTAEGRAGVYGHVNLVNYMKGDYNTVVNILRNEFPFCTEYHDIRLKSNGATNDDITFNVNYNIFHQKPYFEDPDYCFHVVEHSEGVTVNAKYNIYLYEGGPQPEFFSGDIEYEPYFTDLDELNAYFVDDDFADKNDGDTVTINGVEYKIGEKAFATIADAVNAAEANSVIIVLPGTYDENIVIEKALKLKTKNAALNPTVDDAPFKANSETAATITGVWAVNASNITIQGFSFTGAARVKSYGPSTLGDLNNFVFENNYVYDTDEATVAWAESSSVTAGSASADAAAPGFISLYPSYTWLNNYKFLNNKFSNVSDTHIFMVCVHNATFIGNVFSGGDRDGIRFEYAATYGNIVIEDNVFENLAYNGVYIRSYVGSPYAGDLYVNVYNNTFKNIGSAAATQAVTSTRIGAISTRGYGETWSAYFNIKFNVFEDCANYISLRDNVTKYSDWAPKGKIWAAVIEYNAFIDVDGVDYYFQNLLNASDTEETNTGNVLINHNYYGTDIVNQAVIDEEQFGYHRAEESNLVVYETLSALLAAIAALEEGE